MEILLTLVFFSLSLIFCQSVTVRDNENVYEPEPKRYIYPEPQLAADNLGQDDQLQYYKAARRYERIPTPTVQYIIPEDAIPETDFNYPSQQPLEQRTDNVPPGYEQLTKRLGANARQPPVEQYLKEVTPTTKTTYNRRAGNYPRSNGQPTVRSNKQRTEETQRNILKQSPFQYVLQPEPQQKPQFQPHIQYEVSVQKQVQPQQSDASGLSQYQNALLAHQKVLLEATSPDESKSSIYVNHAIPKKPTRKLVKPKEPPAGEEVQYYQQIEQYQQQAQSKQPQFYEQQQPAEVMYQAKLNYPKESATTDEVPPYQPQLRQYQQQILQYQQSPPRQVPAKKASRRPTVKYQQLYQVAQESHDPSLEYQTATKAVEAPSGHRPTPLRQGPKYLPDPKRYPSPADELSTKYQQVVLPGPQQQPLISYEAAIEKLHSDQLRHRSPPGQQQQIYRPQEQVQPGKYQLQYPEESQQDPNQQDAEIEYVRPEHTSKLRPAGRAQSYRQTFPNSNVRYYRNLARPVPYPSYE